MVSGQTISSLWAGVALSTTPESSEASRVVFRSSVYPARTSRSMSVVYLNTPETASGHTGLLRVCRSWHDSTSALAEPMPPVPAPSLSAGRQPLQTEHAPAGFLALNYPCVVQNELSVCHEPAVQIELQMRAHDSESRATMRHAHDRAWSAPGCPLWLPGPRPWAPAPTRAVCGRSPG